MINLRGRNEYSDELNPYITLDGHGIPIAYLKSISFSITREMAPVYALGCVQSHSFARGKCGIAGELVFKELSVPVPDEFDVYIGHHTGVRLYNVSLIEEGSSVDMTRLEVNKTYTFVAKEIHERVIK